VNFLFWLFHENECMRIVARVGVVDFGGHHVTISTNGVFMFVVGMLQNLLLATSLNTEVQKNEFCRHQRMTK